MQIGMHVYIYTYIFKVQSLKKKSIAEVSNKLYLFKIHFLSLAFQ